MLVARTRKLMPSHLAQWGLVMGEAQSQLALLCQLALKRQGALLA